MSDVKARLVTFLRELRPRLVVTAAAAGADVLVLEAALETGTAVSVVLPFDRALFRANSVADRGEAWLARYDRVLETVTARNGCRLVEHGERPNDQGYRAGNRLLLEHTQAEAGRDGVLALAVRPRPDSEPSMTDDFVDQAAQRGIVAVDIDPTVRLSDRRRAFVVMPFGRKRIGDRTVDCDVTFRRLLVPLLEDADLAWERADQEIDSGIIHLGMIEQLANADVVVVDTIGDNPNVYYELGLRHAFANRVTVLLGPQGTSPPFDTRPVRQFSYSLPGTSLKDDAALAAIAQLRPVFDPERLRKRQPDSPVYYYFDAQPRRLQLRDGDQPRRLMDLHRAVERARSARDVDALDRLGHELPDEPLHHRERAQLLLLVGMALRENERYARAVQVLQSAPYTQSDGKHPLWAQQLALALRRCGEEVVARGDDPEPAWRQAQSLLEEVRSESGNDPETCGIAAGLAKQRAVRALGRGQRDLARGLLESAAQLYVEGAEAAPTDYYTVLNAATSSRVLAQRLDGPADALARAERLLPIARYFAERAAAADPRDFWARVTVAECVLTAHLLGQNVELDHVAREYGRAVALDPPADGVRSVRNQLRFYELAHDPAQPLQRIEQVLRSAPP